VCILVNEAYNVANVVYTNQCEGLGTGDDADYTVQVKRTVHANPSAWNTASYIGGTACGGEDQVHGHGPGDNGNFISCN
jgi:hypothetical protein